MPKRIKGIICDFKDTEVGRIYERPIWKGFRIWESVKWPILQNKDFYEKFRRIVNSVGSPPFDIFSDWLMDFATIAAGKLGDKAWENYRNLILLHVPTCNSKCWYCFNDAWGGKSDCDFDEVPAREVIKFFLEQCEFNKSIKGRENNVLRLSGGEPFTQPKVIKDLALEFEKVIKGNEEIKNKNLFLWVDTNLMFSRENKPLNEALEALSKIKSNVAIHACFHGISNVSIKKITGKKWEIETLLDNYEFLMKKYGFDIYPRFNPCAVTPKETEEFFFNLYRKDKNSPAKVYLGIIELHYEANLKRFNEVKNEIANNKRKKPNYYSPSASIFWWNRMMEEVYGFGYGKIPRHIINNLRMPKLKNTIAMKQIENIKKERPDEEFLLVSKGTFRENYALKILESLALPEKCYMNIEMGKRYIEPNFWRFVEHFPENFINKKVLVVAVHAERRGVFHMTFLRWAKLKKIWNSPESTILEVELEHYPYIEKTEQYTEGNLKNLGIENYEKFARYIGKKNLPLNGYFLQLMALPSNFQILKNNLEKFQKEGFFQNVSCLSDAIWAGIKKNVYYRISEINRIRRQGDRRESVERERGILILKPDDDIEIKIVSFNQNLGIEGYPGENQAILNVSTTEKDIKIISPEMIRLSRFGHQTVRLKIPPTKFLLTGEIIIKPRDIFDDVRIIEIRLPFKIQPEEVI